MSILGQSGMLPKPVGEALADIFKIGDSAALARDLMSGLDASNGSGSPIADIDTSWSGLGQLAEILQDRPGRLFADQFAFSFDVEDSFCFDGLRDLLGGVRHAVWPEGLHAPELSSFVLEFFGSSFGGEAQPHGGSSNPLFPVLSFVAETGEGQGLQPESSDKHGTIELSFPWSLETLEVAKSPVIATDAIPGLVEASERWHDVTTAFEGHDAFSDLCHVVRDVSHAIWNEVSMQGAGVGILDQAPAELPHLSWLIT